MVEGQGPKFTHYHQPSDSARTSKTVASAPIPDKKSDNTSLKSVVSLVVFIAVLYGVSQLSGIMEETMQNSLPGSRDEHATDPFDRIFGSEFTTKFKNNTRNKGFLKKEADLKKRSETAKLNFRKKGTTSTVKDICGHLQGNKDIVVLMQKFAANDIEEGMRYLKSSRLDIRPIAPLAFQGFTMREIIGDAHEGRNISRLRLASAYILDCLLTNASSRERVSNPASAASVVVATTTTMGTGSGSSARNKK